MCCTICLSSITTTSPFHSRPVKLEVATAILVPESANPSIDRLVVLFRYNNLAIYVTLQSEHKDSEAKSHHSKFAAIVHVDVCAPFPEQRKKKEYF